MLDSAVLVAWLEGWTVEAPGSEDWLEIIWFPSSITEFEHGSNGFTVSIWSSGTLEQDIMAWFLRLMGSTMINRMPWKARFTWNFAAVTLLFLCSLAAIAGHVEAAISQPQGTQALQVGMASQFVFADFDGDTRPDFATVQVGQGNASDARYRIRFQLSTGPGQTIDLTAPTGGLDIRSRDVNGDTFPDVIVTTSWTNRPVAVLLNDGRGNFIPSDPSVFPGAFQTSERSWTHTTDEIRDAYAALFSRYLSGDYEEGDRAFSPPDESRLPIASSSQFAALSTVVFSFGRAPPSFSLHL